MESFRRLDLLDVLLQALCSADVHAGDIPVTHPANKLQNGRGALSEHPRRVQAGRGSNRGVDKTGQPTSGRDALGSRRWKRKT